MILKLKVWLLKRLLQDVAKQGIEGDTKLAHINKFEDRLLKQMGGEGSINPDTGLVQYKGGGGGGQSTSNTLDPNIVPYVTDALSEQKALYNQGPAEYYPGQTYLSANTNQQNAMNQMGANANVNSGMLQNSTDLNNQMIQGDFLQNNPNFPGGNPTQQHKMKCREAALQFWLSNSANYACCSESMWGTNPVANGGNGDTLGCVTQGWINLMNNFVTNSPGWPAQGCNWLNNALANVTTQQQNFQPGSAGWCKTQGKIDFINNFKATGQSTYVNGSASFPLPCV